MGLLDSLLGCGCGWESGVKEAYDGTERVLKKFPKQTYDMGQTILKAFNVQVENLKALNKTETVVLATRSTDLLRALSLLSNVDFTPSVLLTQLKQTLPDKTAAYTKIISGLSKNIGKLQSPVIEAMTSVQTSIMTVLKQFDKRFSERKQNRCEKIDFKIMANSTLAHANLIAFIVDSATNNSNETTANKTDELPFAAETFEALAILTFISNLQLLSVHGANANIGSVLIAETTDISPFLKSSFAAFELLISAITKLISSASFDGVENMEKYLRNYVETIYLYIGYLEQLLDVGPFKVNITAAEVNGNLARSEAKPETKSEEKSDVQPETKSEDKSDAKTEAQSKAKSQ